MNKEQAIERLKSVGGLEDVIDWIENRKKYFIDMDNSCHEYRIEADRKKDWREWQELDEEDERAWEQPDYAERIDGEDLYFYLQ